MFILRGEVENSGNVVIIDLDDKSLYQVGQWPWSRDTVAELLINMSNAGVGLIGMDIAFAEEDRTNLQNNRKIQYQNNTKHTA